MENFFITVSTSFYDDNEKLIFVNKLDFVKQFCKSRKIKLIDEKLFMNGGDFLQKKIEIKGSELQAIELFTICTLTSFTVTLYRKWFTALSKDTALEVILLYIKPNHISE